MENEHLQVKKKKNRKMKREKDGGRAAQPHHGNKVGKHMEKSQNGGVMSIEQDGTFFFFFFQISSYN
jgi:hypothetical protein